MHHSQELKRRELLDLHTTLGKAASTPDQKLRKRLTREGLTECTNQITDFQEAIAARSHKSPHDIIDRDRHLILAGFHLLKGETEEAKEIIGRYFDLQGPHGRLHPDWVALADHVGLGPQMEEQCSAGEIAYCRDQTPRHCFRKVMYALSTSAANTPARPQGTAPQHGHTHLTNG